MCIFTSIPIRLNELQFPHTYKHSPKNKANDTDFPQSQITGITREQNQCSHKQHPARYTGVAGSASVWGFLCRERVCGRSQRPNKYLSTLITFSLHVLSVYFRFLRSFLLYFSFSSESLGISGMILVSCCRLEGECIRVI